MDKLDRIRGLRDAYESSLDEAERLRDQYHREIVKLHRSGMSLREIADGLGISHQRVHQIVTPHEDRPPAKRKRGIVAGGTVAIVLLAAGLGMFLARDGSPPAQRASGGSSLETGQTRAMTGCPHLPFPVSLEHTCMGSHVLVVDPRTGEILARSIPPTAAQLAAREASRQEQRARQHEMGQMRDQLRAAERQARLEAKAAALAAAAQGPIVN